MNRVVTELHIFTPDDLIEMAKKQAQASIISSLYKGEIKKQDHEWSPDGNILKIITTHVPED